MKKNISTIILILIFIVGLSVLLYPTVSNYVNELHQSKAVATYDEAVADMSDTDYTELFRAAEAYNKELADNPDAFYTPEVLSGYKEKLNINGTGIMGYITIEKIGVELPIYHGTDPSVLEKACGHLEGTSLPIGGENTHTVLSAHRGFPSAKLFTDLDQIEEGDTFTITVLNRVMTYQVDEISIVLPGEVDSLKIKENEDRCTLITCTPYGINTHRLLVHAHRIENLAGTENVRISADALQIEPLLVAPVLAIPILLVMLIMVLIPHKKDDYRGDRENEENL